MLGPGAAMLIMSCSFVLDTNDLHKGGAAGASPGTGGSSGEPIADAAIDAPTCNFPDHDACSMCLGTSCCTEYGACAHDGACNIAFVDFQQCQRNAKKAANPTIAQAVCAETFRARGGTLATTLFGCTLTNCPTACGG